MLSESYTNSYLVNGVVCKLCQEHIWGINKFKEHLENVEKISQQVYFNEFIMPEFNLEGKCRTCGKPTKFIDVFTGYEPYCCKECLDNDFKDNSVDKYLR